MALKCVVDSIFNSDKGSVKIDNCECDFLQSIVRRASRFLVSVSWQRGLFTRCQEFGDTRFVSRENTATLLSKLMQSIKLVSFSLFLHFAILWQSNFSDLSYGSTTHVTYYQ